MSGTLVALINGALNRIYGDMLPVLVACDKADEEGYDTKNVRGHVAALLALQHDESDVDNRMARWRENDNINWYIRRLKPVGE